MTAVIGILMRTCLTGVRHFLAALVLTAVLASASSAVAQSQCSEVFSQRIVMYDEIDDLSNEKALRLMVRKNSKKLKTIEAEILGQKTQIPVPHNYIRVLNVERLFDIVTMGPLAKIFDFKRNRETKKFELKKHPQDSLALEKLTKSIYERSSQPTEENMQMIRKAIGISKLTDETTFVRVAWNKDSNLSELEHAIFSRYSLLYIQMANWTYRRSGLEKNKPLTNARMMDEIASYGKEMKVFDYSLTFDTNVWNAQLRILNDQMEAYKAETDPKQKEEILGQIVNSHLSADEMTGVAFLPFAGVATAHHALDLSQPFEVKRYFSNNLEDPFNLAGVKDKNEYVLRQRMLLKVAEQLPPNSSLEVHAHTLIHVRTYARLGFSDTGLIKNPKYPDAEIRLLKATREEVIERIQSNLDKIQ